MATALLKEAVLEAVERALDQIEKISGRPAARLEYARAEKFGDYACTAAMDRELREAFSLSHPEFKNPRTFAEAISESIKNTGAELFQTVELAGPGFINLTLKPGVLFDRVLVANVARDDFGRSVSRNPRKIIFEYVSANPTGPLNIVSARAAALGDSCCNLLEAAGETVTREYYVNDHGNQVDMLGQSVLLRYLESQGARLKFSERKENGDAIYPAGAGLGFPVNGYHGVYITNAVHSLEKAGRLPQLREDVIRDIVRDSNEQPVDEVASYLAEQKLESVPSQFGRAAINHFIETQKRDLGEFRAAFDNFFRESSLHESGEVMELVGVLKNYLRKEDGKLLFSSTRFGDEKDRVVVRDDGRPTYLMADIAYHRTKIARGFDEVYNIWGPDHHGYIARLHGAMQAMGFPAEKFKVLIAQQVNLLEDRVPVDMSKRAGKIVTMATLLEEIPVDVSRYFFAMRSFESHLDFDLKEARDTSDKNPYYYVAYAHARIRSIFARAAEMAIESGTKATWGRADFELTPERRRLMRLVAQFPEEVQDAALNLEPHRLVTYLYGLAQALAKFYAPRENRVIEQDEDTAGVLLAILDAVSICLKNGLALLGMKAPERMPERVDS